MLKFPEDNDTILSNCSGGITVNQKFIFTYKVRVKQFVFRLTKIKRVYYFNKFAERTIEELLW